MVVIGISFFIIVIVGFIALYIYSYVGYKKNEEEKKRLEEYKRENFHIYFYKECEKNNIKSIKSAEKKQRAILLGNRMGLRQVTEYNVDDLFNRGKAYVEEEKKKQEQENIASQREEQRNLIAQLNNKYQNIYGRNKRVVMINDELATLRRAKDAMENSVNALAASAYQEKELDWASMGGAASAIGGVGAGIAVASQAQRENEEIRARNAANQSAVHSYATSIIKNNMSLYDKINELEKDLKKVPMALMDEKIKKEQLFEKLDITCTPESDKIGVVSVTARIKTKESFKIFETVSATIDGLLKADVSINDETVASTLLVLPFEGIYACNKYQTVTGKVVIPYDDRNKNISVTITPHSLWAIERV